MHNSQLLFFLDHTKATLSVFFTLSLAFYQTYPYLCKITNMYKTLKYCNL